MELTEKQVEETAALARLKPEKEFQKELSAILDFMEKLNEVKTDKVEPISHITGLENVTREDKAASFKKDLISLAPQKEKGCIKVKDVL
jgi:aspartyl-tRNA(Asn)/glutamyl-tRNA(Gln) amidotransferase subunit C